MENPLGLKATFYHLDDESVASVFSFKSQHQSYPDRTHGGMISALLDEIIGRAIWIYEPEVFGVTTTLQVTFRRAVPPEQPLKARGYVTYNSPRGFYGKGEIYDMDGKLLTEATAKYLKIPFSKLFSENSDAHTEMCYKMPIAVDSIDFPPKNL